MSRRWTNWAGNQSARPSQWLSPDSADELADVVGAAAGASRRVKVVGSGHSFTATAVADDVLVDMSRMRGVGFVDVENRIVEVAAGTTISTLNEELAVQGWALANMGDITAQTIAGAISTSTHGTGIGLTGLAAQVVSMTVVDGRGAVRTLDSRDGELFRAAQVGVGSLGVIASVHLRVVPAFVLRATEAPMRLDAVFRNLPSLVHGNDHFEFYWVPHTRWVLSKINNRTNESIDPMSWSRQWWQKSFLENTAFGVVCRIGRRAPGLIPRLATALPASGQLTYANDSHKVFATSRRVRFVEMEYAIPYEACEEALSRVVRMVDDRGFKVSFPVEVRFTAPDTPMLSTSHGRTSAYVAVHMFKGMEFEGYFKEVAKIMADYSGRPHWGKMHYLGADELAGLYPDWNKFLAAREVLDPDRTFENAYTRRVFGGRD